MGELLLMCCMSSIVSSGAGAGGYFLGYIPDTVKYYERKILELVPKVKSIMSSLELNDGEVNLFVPDQFSSLKELVESMGELDDIIDRVKQRSHIELSEHVRKQTREIREAHDLFNVYKDKISKINVYLRGFDELVLSVKGNQDMLNELNSIELTSSMSRDDYIGKFNEIINNYKLKSYPNDMCTITDFLTRQKNGFKSFNEYVDSRIPETSFTVNDLNGNPMKMNHFQGLFMTLSDKC